MDMSRSEDSVDITATFARLDALAARWRLTGALRRESRDYRVLKHAPATIGLRASMANRLSLNALQGDLNGIRYAYLPCAAHDGLISVRGANYSEAGPTAQRDDKSEAHGSSPSPDRITNDECAFGSSN